MTEHRTSLASIVGTPRYIIWIGGIYGASVIVLGLSDMLLSHRAEASVFGTYQYVRFLLPLIVIVGLLGIDQVMSRLLPGDRARRVDWLALLPRRVVVASLLASAAAVASVALLKLPVAAAIALTLTPPVLVCAEFCAGYLRAVGKYAEAAFVQQGYRLLLGSVVLLTLGKASTVGNGYPLLILGAAAVFGMVGIRRMSRDAQPCRQLAEVEIRELRVTGLWFAGILLGLGGVDWVDQAALVSQFDSFAVGGEYAAVKVYVAFPFVSLVSILGFRMLPEVAKRRDALTPGFLWRAQATALIAGTTLAAGIVTLFAAAPSVLPVRASWLVLVGLAASGIARFLALVPGAVLGAMGSPRALRLFAVAGVMILCLEAVAVVVSASHFSPLTAGTVALVIATWGRLIISTVLASSAIRRGVEEGALRKSAVGLGVR